MKLGKMNVAGGWLMVMLAITVLAFVLLSSFDVHARVLIFGYLGLSLMAAMNLYSLRKRARVCENFGPPLSAWLNFHILCGMIGPLFIVFHSRLKMHGLAGMSFWAMIISVISGMLGHYLFREIRSRASELEIQAQSSLAKMKRAMGDGPDDGRRLENLRMEVLSQAGAARTTGPTGLWKALSNSLLGDLRLLFWRANYPYNLPPQAWDHLRDFARSKRRAQYLDPMQKMVRHWHTFHFPFAIFTYASALVHVVIVLLFPVGS